jgi:hypothetical protein
MGFLFDADPRLLRLWGITTLVFMTTVIFFGAVCTMLTPMESPAKALMARQFVSPSNAELMVNTIGFGLCALLCFVMRMYVGHSRINRSSTTPHYEDSSNQLYITASVVLG